MPCATIPSGQLDEIENDNAILLGGNQAKERPSILNKDGFQFQSGLIFNRNPQPQE